MVFVLMEGRNIIPKKTVERVPKLSSNLNLSISIKNYNIFTDIGGCTNFTLPIQCSRLNHQKISVTKRIIIKYKKIQETL